MIRRTIIRTLQLVVLLAPAMAIRPADAGDLNPPAGPVTGTMKTLTDVEPRIAVNATNTPGDATTVYKITQPGSYYLTGNVTGVSGRYGIAIAASGVTLDLNGFDVVGVPGSLDGISSTAPNMQNVTVVNGSIRSWGNSGLDLDTEGTRNCRVAGLNASGNGNWGIVVGASSTVSNCTADSNTGSGIYANIACTISECTARNNTINGIYAYENCTVAKCSASQNTANGIVVQYGSVASDCSAYLNSSNGIHAISGSSVLRCTAMSNSGIGIYSVSGGTVSDCAAAVNAVGIIVSSYATVAGCTVGGNTADGIECYAACIIRDNNVSYSGNGGIGAGIHATGTGNRIEGNHCTLADRGLDIDGANNYVADNTVRDNTDNYDIAAGNQLNLLLGQIPESIDWPATVKLAGDLPGASGSNGITIAADNVTIDLDGHALVGVGGSLDGINVSGSRRNIAIRNGTCRNWPGDGVDAANAGNSRFDDLKLSNNSGDGLRVGVDCAVRACSSLSNAGDGIENGGNGTILECVSNANTQTGILGGDSTIVANCEAAFNSADGIRVATGSTVRHCTVRGSAGDGIEAGTSCTIVENQTDLNGNGAGSGAGVHITGTGNRVEGNSCLSADRGVDVDSTGNLIIRNTARSNTTNYDIVAGNRYGPIIDITAGGTAAVSGNSAASTVSSTDPWANFAH